MKEQLLDVKEAPTPWFAARDRKLRNIANKSHYTAAQLLQADKMQMALTLVYNGTVYEPSYGTNGISVKATGKVTDKKSLRLLEADWDKQGIVKRVTPQGVCYRFKKA